MARGIYPDQINKTLTTDEHGLESRNFTNGRKTERSAFGRKPNHSNFPEKCGGLPTRRYDEPDFFSALGLFFYPCPSVVNFVS